MNKRAPTPVTEDLAAAIKRLRGGMSRQDFARRCRLSHRTLVSLELPPGPAGTVKLDTLRVLARALRLQNAEYLNLLLAWIRATIGEDDARRLRLQPAGAEAHAAFLAAFENLPMRDQVNLQLAAGRPAVLNALAAFHQAFDAMNQAGGKEKGLR